MTDAERQVVVRVAARALARSGLAHAYGHCSQRIDKDSLLVCAARPMGLIKPGEPGTVVPIDGPLPDGVLGEVRIHREIYKRRPDVGGVARTMPPAAMTLGALGIAPKPRHGPGAYFAPQPPIWDDPMLLRDDADAARMAEQFGQGRAILMRGNGVVTAGASLQEAVVMTWYLEDASRVELAARQIGVADTAPVFTPEQIKKRAVGTGRIYERMWEYLTASDPEEELLKPWTA
jgi:HCOMODA/2-hydroxy-3-carboxy-muconic semialdehyde decarboxylase